jgi:hypothetical protein
MNEPKTLSEGIDRIRDKLITLEWTDIVQKRASIQSNQATGQDKPQIRPMVHVGNGEYLDCRPNDTYKSVVFFVSKDPEKNDYNLAMPKAHAPSHILRTQRAVTLIGWVNLAELPDYDDGTGFPELIKVELKNALKWVRCITSIGDYQDGPLSEVFKPFQVSDMDRKYDRWPFACFKLELTVMTIECNP